MQEFVMLRFDEVYLQRHELPDAYLPVGLPLSASLPPDALLRLLQERASTWSAWQTLEPIWERLVARLAREESAGQALDCEAQDWDIRLGPVNLDATVITLQRGEYVIAAIAPRRNGRLVASTFHPLDARALNLLTGLSVRPAADGSVAMRPNNWEYALDQTALLGQAYAADRGETYLALWEYGLGVSSDGGRVEACYEQRTAFPRSPQHAAAELRAFVRWAKTPRVQLSLAEEPAPHVGIIVSPSLVGAASTLSGRVRGCLLGGAVGDALGAPVEFLSLAEIRRRFGHDGIREYAPAFGRNGAITDDTQMTMFTAEGLLRAWVRGTLKGICHQASVIHHAYLRWLLTQGERVRNPDLTVGEDGWLFQLNTLHSRRAPGNTCLTALKAARGIGDPAIAENTSKGCGGIMRAAPVGLFATDVDGDDGVFDHAADAAALTHGHPSGFLSAGYLAVAIAALLRGCGLPEALEAADVQLRRRKRHQEVAEAVTAAKALAARGRPTPEQLENLGAGWVAEEALAIAICCSLTAKSFADGVTLAANHSGDSDSTAAITGNILGALLGEGAIPTRWLEDLELYDEIASLADDIRAAKSGALDAEAVWERYPGW